MSKKILSYLVIAVSLSMLIYSGVKLYEIFKDYHTASSEYDEIAEKVVVEEEIIEETKEKEENKYVRKINFDKLIEINEDVCGWIWQDGTVIDYPIMKSKDNADYLYTTINGTQSSSGSIFMDAYNAVEFSDFNTIIYGHNMKNGSMFHTLNKLSDLKYFMGHNTFWIFKLDDIGNEYKIISCYITDSSSSAYNISFEDLDEYNDWLDKISAKSYHKDYITKYDKHKETITLSTCHGAPGGNQRFVVHLQKK